MPRDMSGLGCNENDAYEANVGKEKRIKPKKATAIEKRIHKLAEFMHNKWQDIGYDGPSGISYKRAMLKYADAVLLEIEASAWDREALRIGRRLIFLGRKTRELGSENVGRALEREGMDLCAAVRARRKRGR